MLLSYAFSPASKGQKGHIIVKERIPSSGRDTEVGMSQSPKADVIIAVDHYRATLFDCVDRVLEHGGEHLGRLIVFDAAVVRTHTLSSG